MKKFSAVIVLVLLLSSSAAAAVIDRVEVTGNKRVPESRMKMYLMKPGDTFDPARIDQSIKDLHNTGYFSEVLVDATVEGDEFVITYILRETPLIASIEFQGNKKFKEDKFKDLLSIKVGDTLNLTKLGNTINDIRNFYEKERYFSVEINYAIQYRNESSVNIIFEINEGTTSRVYNIWTYGNEIITGDEIREAMLTKEKDFWSRLNSSGTLIQDKMEFDREMIRDLYRSRGFLNVEIGEPDIAFQEDLSRINYKVRIKEGPQFTVRSVTFEDAQDIIPLDNLRELARIKPGEYFNVNEFRSDFGRITRAYSEKGYARVVVDAQPMVDELERMVDVTYVIEPGNIYYVNRINFTGNEKSKDNVLRREFDIVEGQQYNSALISEARRNLMTTGFYENVEITENYPDGTTTDIIVNVVEKKNSSLNLSIAYSSVDQIVGRIQYSHANVLGFGNTISLTAEMAPKRHEYSFSFFEPWVYDNPFTFGFDVYSLKREYDDYTKKSMGGRIRVGHQPVKRRLFLTYIFAHEQVMITDISDTASKYIREQEGLVIINSVTPAITYSNLNNNLDPSEGIVLDARVKYAGTFLGGSADFAKLGVSAKYYKPVAYSFVAALNVEGGHIWALGDSKIPIDERYYLGGIYSVRGFSYRDISPVDSEGQPYGGNKYYQTNFELWRPLFEGNMSIRGVLFFDMGQVFGENEVFFATPPRKSVGLGLRFITPMGLVRLEYGYKLDKRPGESPSALEFSIGSIF